MFNFTAYDLNNIELHGCAETQKIMQGISPATEEDWHTEYLAPILSIKIVSGIEQVIEHINHMAQNIPMELSRKAWTWRKGLSNRLIRYRY